jgi:DNA-binding MarR family transcriptional regulator
MQHKDTGTKITSEPDQASNIGNVHPASAAMSRADREVISTHRVALHVEPGALQDSVGFHVLRANRIVQQSWTMHGGEHTFRQLFYSAFVLIGTNPGISLVELARYVAIDKSRASEMLDVMEQQQFVTRRRQSEDHRRQGLYLTPTGAARLAVMRQAVGQHEQRFRELFTPAEQQQLVELLERFARLNN